ncbi:type II toxin-antitoxin system RatA family toxin [Rhodospirillaceae bacterium KN72]|uniref:Type II toxin-antitoxin system RatA family toxin n=1 Tax=Pacificispira spongiicola TaxID=2729598 RepID=A0A7Y0HHK6_9PROT|nr:type II toxin-antitoxin system RatA family toxin [Pacificispira spongiicola]NMM45997.1 type II toxin-antitoxin system RatA family toxin [Pacificispira spongiicola]
MPSHTEQRFLPYRAEDMYKLVADVGRYPEFLPWCRAARIRTQTDTLLVADLVIGFKGITERFTSRVTLDPGNLEVLTAYEDGPFKYLDNSWRFIPNPDSGGCRVEFHVDFEFKSRMLQAMIGLVFTEAVKRMVAAFEERARVLYGKQL